ncbi:MAG: hypothetical protein WCT03_23170, partial [Candidatus Obscuribacterales bacterium]
MSRPSSEVEVLSEYAYEETLKASAIAHLTGRICILAGFIALNWIARNKAQRDEIKQILLVAPKYLTPWLTNKRSVCALFVLHVFYIAAWSLWQLTPEVAMNGWLYENICLVVIFAYPALSCIWLKHLFLHRAKLRGESGEQRISIWTLIVCFAVVGFNKLCQILYQTVFLIYAFLAVSAALTLASLFTKQQGFLSAVRYSLVLSRGHFWEFARMFSSTGFYAFGAIVLSQQLHQFLFERPPVQPILNVLFHAAIDTSAAVIWLL